MTTTRLGGATQGGRRTSGCRLSTRPGPRTRRRVEQELADLYTWPNTPSTPAATTLPRGGRGPRRRNDRRGAEAPTTQTTCSSTKKLYKPPGAVTATPSSPDDPPLVMATTSRPVDLLFAEQAVLQYDVRRSYLGHGLLDHFGAAHNRCRVERGHHGGRRQRVVRQCSTSARSATHRSRTAR